MNKNTWKILNGKRGPEAFVDYNPFAGFDAIVDHVLAVEDGVAAVAAGASGSAAAPPPFWVEMDRRKQDRLREFIATECGRAVFAPSAYLEPKAERVTEETYPDERLEVRACGCKSFFCPNCCISKGLKLRARLLKRLDTFKGLMMLTFTVDPQLFASPLEALNYVKEHRCIGVTVQRLHRWKLIHSRRYFCVIEWQENGWPHWHVLIDASRIPFEQLCDAWNRNHDDWEERVAAGRPGFGSVRFSKPGGFASPIHAARYATAYLVKHPQHGYPEWVTAQTTRAVHRYQTSKGFWGESEVEEPEASSESETRSSDADSKYESEQSAIPQRTISDQIASCGSTCNVFKVHDEFDLETGEVRPVYRFVGTLPVTLAQALPLQPDEVNEKGTAAVFRDKAKFYKTLNRLEACRVREARRPIDAGG